MTGTIHLMCIQRLMPSSRRETTCSVCGVVIIMVSGIRKKLLYQCVFFHLGGVHLCLAIYIIVVSGSFILTLRAYRRREVQKIREQQLLAELARERESHRTHEMFINQITYGACTPQGGAMSRADEQLMSQLIAKVRENLSDANYNVEALAAAMNMSRSSLHRKIKALTDLSSLDFIRIIRLKRAAELLQEGELRINEISDRVGFQSPSYFAKIFQKQFGVTPTEFAQQNKQRMAED